MERTELSQLKSEHLYILPSYALDASFVCLISGQWGILMRQSRVVREMLIALGVVAGVIAMGFIALLILGPTLRRSYPMPNICVVNRLSVFDSTAVGKNANLQLFKIIKREQEKINAEKATLDRVVNRSDERINELARKVQKENSELELMRAQTRALVVRAVAPAFKSQSSAARCFTVLDRAAIIDLGGAKDITTDLVKEINRKVPPFPPGTVEQLHVN